MTFESQKSSYTVVSTLFSGEANSCYVARLSDDMGGRSFTVIAVRDHDAIRMLMEAESKIINIANSQLVDAFSYGNDYVLVFPYRQGRPLGSFFVGEALTLSEIEEIGTNLLLACMTASLPYPVLYLLLDQGQINLSKDGGIYFSYIIDLSIMDLKRTERDCTVKCAQILRALLATKENEKNISYELISRKSDNNSYSSFTELYRDLRIGGEDESLGPDQELLQQKCGHSVRNPFLGLCDTRDRSTYHPVVPCCMGKCAYHKAVCQYI